MAGEILPEETKNHLMGLRDVSHRSVECSIGKIAHVHRAPLAGRHSDFSA